MVIQKRMADADEAKIDVNAKADTPDAFDASNIDTPNINVKRGIGKLCDVVIALFQSVSLIQNSLCDSQSDGEGTDIGKFDAKKRQKKRQQNPTRYLYLYVCL